MSNPADLSDEQALTALQFAGRALPQRTGNGTPAQFQRALDVGSIDADGEVLAALTGADAPESAKKRAADVARYALARGLADAALRPTIEDAVAQAAEPPLERSMLGIIVIGAATLIALAIIGKVSYVNGELKVEAGLPGVESAGKAIGALIGAALPPKP